MKNTVFTIFSFATFILVLSFKKCQGPVHARFIVLVDPLNLFLPSISPTNPPFFQEDSESELWQHASWNSINPRTEFPLALALPRARTQPTEEVGLVVKTVRAFSSHFPGKPRGQRVAGGSSSAGDPAFTIRASFPFSHHRKGSVFSSFTFFFFPLLSPREHKHREAGRESGLRARGARSASNGRVVGSCPYMFDVLLIINFFCINIRILFFFSEYYLN